MEVAMEGEEAESARHERVKELEAMVLQLEKENRKLLNKVTESEGKYREEASSSSATVGRRGGKLANATSTDDLISLDGALSDANEDEWLFVSPAKPPTPSQKRVTPSQWLERGGVATADDPVFSLDEVRKDLSFQISNAENLSPSNVRRTPGGAGVSPLSARRKLSNPTAQRYLNQVRERRHSPVEMAGGSSPGGEEEAVPVVRWKRPVLPGPGPPSQPVARGEEEEEEEAVPVVRWKRPVLPGPGSGPPSQPVARGEEEEEEAVPVVRWKRPVLPQPEEEDDVPVVRWKRPVVPQTSPQPPPTATESVPVVKWKKPALPRDDSPEEEVVPTVRWKRPVIPQDNTSEEAVAAGTKPRQQRNIPIKAISTTARSPPEGEEMEEEEVRGHQANTLPRASGRRSLGGGGLRPPAGGPSPHSRQRNASAERASQRQAAAGQTLRSRSPSPGVRQPISAESGSPSPTLHHTSRPSARTARPHPSPSPPRSASLQPPSNKQNLVKTPSAPGPRRLPTPPSSGGSRGRGLPPSHSTPSSTAGQRPVGVSPPASGVGRPQRQLAATTPPRAGVPRPRPQQSPQRGGLGQPSPPRSAPAPQIRPARHTAAPPPSRQQRKAQPQKKVVASTEDDWLEGCF